MRRLTDDMRHAWRMIAKAPGVMTASVLMLALGIGANAAIFTVIDAVLLRPLPFAHAEQLVRITADLTGRGATDVGLAAAELFEYQQRGDLFAQVSGEYAINANLTGANEPERLEGQLVSVGYFDLLGARARLGRTFEARDYAPGISQVVVISDGLWKRRFGADPTVLGRIVQLDDDPCEIIGVMPPGFHHPGPRIQGDTEFWSPAGYRGAPFREPRYAQFELRGAIARLRPGVSMAAAQARLDALAAGLRAAHTDAYRGLGWRPRFVPLRDHLAGSVGPALWLLFGAVGMVLLIACANVANLLLARASARRREFAIRQALGASAGRVLRQLLTESVLLSLMAGALGVLIANWSVALLIGLAPTDVPLMADLAIDQRVLAFSVLVSIVTGLVFGIVPARQAARTDPQDILRESSRSATASRHVHYWRHALVIAEFALALSLLIGASLLLRSFAHLYAIDPGFEANGLLTARLWMPLPNDRSRGRYVPQEAQVRFYREAERRFTARSEVEAAGWISRLPLDGVPRTNPITIEGRPVETGEIVSTEWTLVSPGAFRALGIDLVKGRAFTDRDNADAPQVVVINERVVQRFFPGEDPIGRRIRRGGPTSTAPWLTIVGVVRNVRSQSLGAEAEPQMYRPIWQIPNLAMALVVRARGTASAPASDATLTALGRAIRGEVSAIDPELPLFAVRPMTMVMAEATAQRRFSMVLFGLFAGVALLLAAVGIYATMAYLVRQRSHEIGIRLAMGARPVDAIALIVRRGLTLTIAGACVGITGGVIIARLMAGLLFNVSTLDPVSFAGPALILTFVSLAACYLPASRAARIDPIQTLRVE
jgi:putative ABC transport system permease protein